jgi:hypothetical protein
MFRGTNCAAGTPKSGRWFEAWLSDLPADIESACAKPATFKLSPKPPINLSSLPKLQFAGLASASRMNDVLTPHTAAASSRDSFWRFRSNARAWAKSIRCDASIFIYLSSWKHIIDEKVIYKIN